MPFSKKSLIFAITLLLFSISASAVTVKGTIIDADTKEALPEASVRILAAKDSAFVKGAAANIDGIFNIQGISPGNYIVEANYIGYNPTYRNIHVASKTVDTGTIEVKESSILLKEAVVTAIKTPVKVMEDTVEFNADSYKTQPNAVVEDLLKRLPGVEVDSDGKITANGKEVTKILVDGKEFFSDDPKVASKNLPINMVDKLQVVDRKSDLARMTGVDDGEEETVINLTVKKGMKNGWFGTVEGGYGTDKRYQEALNINRFWNDNQITFIGNANNTNDLGFTDGNGNRFRRFGGNEGINESQQFGINFNVGNKEILRVGGDLMYSHTDRTAWKRQERKYTLPDNNNTDATNTDSRDRGHSLRGDFRVEWKPDSFNALDFRPNFSYNTNESRSYILGRTFNSAADITKTTNNALNDGHSFEFGGRLIYNHNFKQKRGRSFSVQAQYNLSNVRENENSFSWNEFLQLESVEAYSQLLENHTWSNSVGGRLSWTEPLGDVTKGNFIQFSYRMNYRWNNADNVVYDNPVDYSDPLNPQIDYSVLELNEDLSNKYRNDFFSQNIQVGYKKVSKNFNFDGGLSFVPSMSKSVNLLSDDKSIPERWVWNYAPYMRMRFKFSKSRSFNMFYHGRSSQPSMKQLQPVADMSDPLNIIQGNPGLDPTFTHSVNLRFQDFNAESQRSIMAMADIQAVQNSIVSRTVYNTETSGKTTYYENVNGVWSGRAMNMISFPFRNRAWTFNNMTFVNYNQMIGFSSSQNNAADALRNKTKTIMWAITPGIAYRPDNLELELRPNYRLQYTHSSLSTTQASTIHTYGGMFNGTYYTPFGIVLATDVRYTASAGYSAGYDTKAWLWNASISYQFLAGKQATITAKAYDLLNQQSNVRRTVNGNYIEDYEFNSLTRYFMFSFTYRFNTFGKGNEPSSRNNDRFRGPRMGPPGARGPR